MATKKEKREKKKSKYTTTKQRMANRGDFVSNTVKIPEGMEFFKFQLDGEKKKKYLLDIIPYTAGEGNPVADKGQLHWERTYYVHKNVGPQDKWYVCATSTFGEDHPCPVCEHAAKLRRSGKADKEALKEFRPNRRQLFYVVDRANKKKGVQLLDTYGYMKDDTAFGQLIDAKLEAKMDEPDHDYHNFFHLEDGKAIEVLSKKHVMPGAPFVSNAGSIDFVDRKSQYKEGEFDELPSLDEILMEPDYEKMKKVFLEGGSDEEEEEETPKKKKKAKEEDDGDEDENEEDEESEEEGDDDEDKETDDSEDDEGSEEEEEDEKPVKKKKKGKKKKEEEEEDDESEDDSPLEGEDDDDETEEESEDEDDESEEEEEEDEKPKKKGKKTVKKEDEEDEEEDDENAPWDDDSEEEEEEDEEEEDE